VAPLRLWWVRVVATSPARLAHGALGVSPGDVIAERGSLGRAQVEKLFEDAALAGRLLGGAQTDQVSLMIVVRRNSSSGNTRPDCSAAKICSKTRPGCPLVLPDLK
jgi:hypothetical protein